MSERTTGTVKQLLRKAENPYRTLLEYRNTSVTGIGHSPAQMLKSRRLKYSRAELLQPRVALGARERLLAAQQKKKYYYDRHAVIERTGARRRCQGERKWILCSCCHQRYLAFPSILCGANRVRRRIAKELSHIIIVLPACDFPCASCRVRTAMLTGVVTFVK